jgi:hypothetical protein
MMKKLRAFPDRQRTWIKVVLVLLVLAPVLFIASLPLVKYLGTILKGQLETLVEEAFDTPLPPGIARTEREMLEVAPGGSALPPLTVSSDGLAPKRKFTPFEFTLSGCPDASFDLSKQLEVMGVTVDTTVPSCDEYQKYRVDFPQHYKSFAVYVNSPTLIGPTPWEPRFDDVYIRFRRQSVCVLQFIYVTVCGHDCRFENLAHLRALTIADEIARKAGQSIVKTVQRAPEKSRKVFWRCPWQ